MKKILSFILFLIGFIIIGNNHNLLFDLGIDIASLTLEEEDKVGRFIGVLFCIMSIVFFRMIRASKIKKEQERLRIENEKYQLWYKNLSEDERIEIDYKKWVENTNPMQQGWQKNNLIVQSVDNTLFEFAAEEEKGNYEYRKLTPLEERIAFGSKEERANIVEERRAAANKRKADLTRIFKSDEVDKILQNTLWIGMTEEMLLEVKGKPNDTSESVSVGKVKKKYFYGMRKNRVGNYSFDFEVSLENNLVTGWKDRDN